MWRWANYEMIDAAHPRWVKRIAQRREIPPPSMFSIEMLHDAMQWMRSCQSHHEACKISEQAALPSRVLDLGAPSDNRLSPASAYENPIPVNLVETKGTMTGRYMCLSHCWGNVRPACITNKQSLEANKAGISWETIPKTFQDAITFAHRIGVRYLWIDSLCIIQDDESDWAIESAKMADIYSRSYLTIAASFSGDCNAGFLKEPLPVIRGREVTGLEEVGLTDKLFVRTGPYNNCKDFPLTKRAWVYQERLLSPRVLHFTNSEIFWECNTATTCQCNPMSLSDFQGQPSNPKEGSKMEYINNLEKAISNENECQNAWRTMITNYSRLQLSHSTDRLPAISGIAKQFAQHRPPNQYLAGLWENSLIADLCWAHHSLLALGPRPEAWLAPSWSWASIHTGIEFLDLNTHYYYKLRGHSPTQPRIVAEVRRVACVPLHDDPTGRIASGVLELCAPVFDGVLKYEEDYKYEAKYDVWLDGYADAVMGRRGRNNGPEYFHPDYLLEANGPHMVESGSAVRCLLLTDRHWLVLMPSRSVKGAFERIGIGCMALAFVGDDLDSNRMVIRII